MESKLLAAAGAVSAPVLRLVVARPWLSGTTALALSTAALFALFLLGRWDDVEVTSPASAATLINGSAHVAAVEPAIERLDREAHVAAVPISVTEQGSLEALSVSQAWTSADDAPEFTASLRTTAEPAIERTAARMSTSLPAPRGAWLTGAIEEFAEEPPFQHAGRWNDRSLFYPAQTQR
jgi:hypothetical protein